MYPPPIRDNNMANNMARDVSPPNPSNNMAIALSHPMQQQMLSSSQPLFSQQQSTKGTIMERVLHVNITNSLGNLALAGPHGGTWKLVDGTQLQCLGSLGADCTDAGMATAQLNNAMIHDVTLLEHQSSFPVPLGVNISCVPPKEITEIGDAYSYTVLPNVNNSSPQNIYLSEGLTDDMYNWHKLYPQYTKGNLETEGVVNVSNQSYVFVDQNHPAIAVIRFNRDRIGTDIDKMKKMDGNYYKVTRQLLGACNQLLRDQVLNKLSTHDLNTLSVQVHRLNATSWEDLGDGSLAMRNFKLRAGEDEEEAKRKHLRNFTSTPYSYMCRLKVKYEIPNSNPQVGGC
jgi:hypothetical protein